MRFRSCFILAIGCWFTLLATVSTGEDTRVKPSPSAYFPQTDYQFSPIPEGTEITHDFIIQNRGDAPLVVKKVKTG
jgi:hypothetical protein